MGGLIPPPSPCTGTCKLDADDMCLGCGRTIDEIAAWGTMGIDRQRAIIAALPGRLAAIVPTFHRSC